MMNTFSQRLTQLRKQSGQKTAEKTEIFSGRTLAVRLQNARAGSVQKPLQSNINDDDIARKYQGEVLSPGLIMFKTDVDLNCLHGHYAASVASELKYIEKNVDTSALLFVDTETTGLSTAAGTLVFLCGTAEIVDGKLRVEQLLLTRLSAEPQMLSWFNQKCETKTHIVSYNGKSFDIPLLTSRFKMMRMKSDLLCKNQIDLLHWIRRLHQKHLADCRLPSAEKYCLGFERIDDMPGSEAPEVWQQLIRYGNDSRLKPLLQHHLWDVISLAGLLHYADHVLDNQCEAVFDKVSMARYFLKTCQPVKAKLLLEDNISNLNREGIYLLSVIYRQHGEWDKAVKLWMQLQNHAYLPAIEALAKYFEHQKKEFLTASEYARTLVNFDNHVDHQKRLHRLESKLKRHARCTD